MATRIDYALVTEVRHAKVFTSYPAAQAASKRVARELGLPPSTGGAGYLGGKRWVAHIAGRGWLMVAPRGG